MGKLGVRLLDAAAGALFVPYWDAWNSEIGGLRRREFERLQRSQWKDLRAEQERRLLEFTRYAYENCAFYGKRGAPPASIDAFSRLPLLTKEDVRAHGDALVSRAYRIENLVAAKTGGSTGVSLRIYCDRACQQLRNAAAMHSDTWAGWEPGELRGALWGNPPVPRGLKGVLRAALFDRLVFLDTIDMSPANMDRFIAAIDANGIRTLYGHAHSLFVFANHAAARSRADLGIRSIISTSMVLLPHERKRIEEVFGCRVTNRYGCEEVSLIASDCDRHEGLHENMDHVYLEVLRPDGRPAEPGEEGAVVVTELINRGQPLLRYAVGDVTVRSPRACSCGRRSPLLERVVGRTADFLVKTDGGLVAGVSLVERTLTAIPGLAQMQIVQDVVDELVINVVPDEKFSGQTERSLIEEMRRVFGDIAVTIRKNDRLPQEMNGKYRFAICRVPARYQEAAR